MCLLHQQVMCLSHMQALVTQHAIRQRNFHKHRLCTLQMLTHLQLVQAGYQILCHSSFRRHALSLLCRRPQQGLQRS